MLGTRTEAGKLEKPRISAAAQEAWNSAEAMSRIDLRPIRRDVFLRSTGFTGILVLERSRGREGLRPDFGHISRSSCRSTWFLPLYMSGERLVTSSWTWRRRSSFGFFDRHFCILEVGSCCQEGGNDGVVYFFVAMSYQWQGLGETKFHGVEERESAAKVDRILEVYRDQRLFCRLSECLYHSSRILQKAADL